MTPTINWPTYHSPITFPDQPDHPIPTQPDLLSFYSLSINFWCTGWFFWLVPPQKVQSVEDGKIIKPPCIWAYMPSGWPGQTGPECLLKKKWAQFVQNCHHVHRFRVKIYITYFHFFKYSLSFFSNSVVPTPVPDAIEKNIASSPCNPQLKEIVVDNIFDNAWESTSRGEVW